METENIITTSYLTFQLEEEIFSVNVGKVREILEIPKITTVPQSPDYMCGVINLRGNVLPVVDTRIKFGIEPQESTKDTCIVVLEVVIEDQMIQVGALVDKVLDVLEFKAEDINPSPSLGAKYKPEFIEGMGKSNDENFIMILNIDEVFSTDEKSLLQDNFEEGEDQEEISLT